MYCLGVSPWRMRVSLIEKCGMDEAPFVLR